MASALSIEGFFAAITGGTNSEPEVDFPFDRLFRKMGVYLRCLMGAILIGVVIQEPPNCLAPGSENERNDFVNSFCINALKHPISHDDATGKAPTQENTCLYLWFPYVLFAEAFLAFLPFLIYSGSTRAIILPILNEAKDMALVTSGQFEEPSTDVHRQIISPDDDEDEPKTYALSIQNSMKKRLYAKMKLFVEERLRGIRGDELVHAYHFAHIIVKGCVVILQGAILGYFLFLSWPFVGESSCQLPERIGTIIGFNSTHCVFPNYGLFKAIALLDALLCVLLPVISYWQYRNYWKNGFNNNLQRARRLVYGNHIDNFERFIVRLTGKEIDDVRLTVALLHANVDKYIVNKLLTVYAMQIEGDAPEEDKDFRADYPYCCMLCQLLNERIKPKIPFFPYELENVEVKTN